MVLEILCYGMLTTPFLSVACPDTAKNKLDRMLFSFALPNITLQAVFSTIHCISWVLFVHFCMGPVVNIVGKV
jgi:hypothetical protein